MMGDVSQCAWQRPPTTRPTTFHVWKTRGCQCSFRLPMMGCVSPETCWASYKYGIIKCWYIVASCWIFLYEFQYQSRPEEGYPGASSFPPGKFRTNLKVIHDRALIKNSQNKINKCNNVRIIFFYAKFIPLLNFNKAHEKQYLVVCSNSLKMIKIDRSMSELLQIVWGKNIILTLVHLLVLLCEC